MTAVLAVLIGLGIVGCLTGAIMAGPIVRRLWPDGSLYHRLSAKAESS